MMRQLPKNQKFKSIYLNTPGVLNQSSFKSTNQPYSSKFHSIQLSTVTFANNNTSTIKSSPINFPCNSYSTKSHNHIETRIQNDTFFIKFNRPTKRNCLNFDSIEFLKKSLNEINQISSIDKIVFRGEGGNFCSGFDLNELREENKLKLIELLSDESWFQSDKLLIAYVQGFAVGLGFELALASDILIADHSAKFGFLNRRFGLPSFLPLYKYRNLIGRLKAIDLLDCPQLIFSKQANDIGLITYQIENESSLNQILNSIQIDKNKLKNNRERLNANFKLHKSKELPDEWINHNLNTSNYNPNKSRHGKYDLSYWKEI